MTSSRQKEILQLKVDQQRNLLYALSETNVRGHTHSIIEIFDLGFFGNEFKHLTTIEMGELAEQIDSWYGRQRNPQVSKSEWASLFNVVDIQPV